MNILYVYAHPNPNSFNAFLKKDALDVLISAEQTVCVSDLYAQQFIPQASWNDFAMPSSMLSSQYFAAQGEAYKQHKLASDIQVEIDKVKDAQHIIFQFPLWWFSMPAILKGWLDRVLTKGFAYEPGKVFDDGLLHGKTASLTVSTQSPAEAYQRDGLHGATLKEFLLPIHHTLRFVGVRCLEPFITYNAFNIDTEQQNKIRQEYASYLQQIVKQAN